MSKVVPLSEIKIIKKNAPHETLYAVAPAVSLAMVDVAIPLTGGAAILAKRRERAATAAATAAAAATPPPAEPEAPLPVRAMSCFGAPSLPPPLTPRS